MRIRYLSATFFIFCLACTASASDWRSADYQHCLDAAEAIDPNIRECANNEFGRQEAALNDTYKQAMITRTQAQQSELRLQERAWIRQTKAKCARVNPEGGAGGSLDQTMQTDCYSQADQVRTEELRRLIPVQ